MPRFASFSGPRIPRQARPRPRTAEWLLNRRPDLAHLTIRFDAVLVLPARWPRHLADVDTQT
jgi:putative endonuclease